MQQKGIFMLSTPYKQILGKYAFWLSVLILLFVFFILTPITGDDFTFLAYHNSLHGLHDYLAANQYMYSQLNGRVIGNLTALLLANHLLLSSLFRAVVVWIILYVGLRVMSINTITMRNATVAAAIFLPTSIFSQTYGWRAGFYNYITPLAVAALLAFIFTSYAKMDTFAKRALAVSAMFTLSVVECLFVENVTLAFVIICTVVMLWAIIKYRAYVWLAASMLIGSIAGTIIMFSSPIYGSVAAGNDDYRQTALGPGGHLANTIFHHSVDYSSFFLSGNPLLYVALSALGIYLVITNRSRLPKLFRWRLNERILKPWLLTVLLGAPLYFVFSQSFTGLNRLSAHVYDAYAVVNFLILVVYVITIGTVISIYVKEAFVRYASLSLIATAILVTLPLLIVSPYGGRNFYISYILIVLAVGCMLNYSFASQLARYEKKGLKALSYVSLSAVAAIYLAVFTVIFVHQLHNQHQLSEQVRAGKTEVVLRKFPLNLFIQDSHNAKKAKRVYGQCHCVYAQCTGCDNFSLRFK